jgi:hypothetical protein
MFARIPEAGSARLFLLLDPFENVVMGSRAAREKAVYRFLLIHKDLEHYIELCQYIQAQMVDIDAGKLQRTAMLPNLRVTEDQCFQPIGVHPGYFREVEDDIHGVGFHKRVYRGTKGRFRVACFQLSSQIENLNPLFFALLETQIHSQPRDGLFVPISLRQQSRGCLSNSRYEPLRNRGRAGLIVPQRGEPEAVRERRAHRVGNKVDRQDPARG